MVMVVGTINAEHDIHTVTVESIAKEKCQFLGNEL
jgi:UDP-N-acetylmuramyl pentapeptide synthase